MTDTQSPDIEAMPMFYRQPAPVSAQRHEKAGLKAQTGFGFAGETNAVTLAGSEFARAARYYPIAFTTGDSPVPVAVLGLRDRENVFVNENGQWLTGHYVPAYVRRYPFIFMSAKDDPERLILSVDEGAENFEAESQAPFFVDGKPSEAVSDVLRFCESFQVQHEDTRRFCQWLAEHDTLEDKVARVKLGSGEVHTMRGFRLLNPQKLRELTDEHVLLLHRRGWLALLHFHMQSLENWQRLADLALKENEGERVGEAHAD